MRSLLCCPADRTNFISLRIPLSHISVPHISPACAGDTPLHIAAAKGQVSIVQALLGAHASPGTVNRAGRTPEMMAIAFGQAAAVQALRAAAPAQPAAPGPGPAAPNPYPSMVGPGLSVTGSGGSGGGSAPPWGLEPALQRLSPQPQPQPQPVAISVPSYPGIPPPIPLDRVSPQLVLERVSPQPGLPAAPQGMQRVSPLPRGSVGPSPAMSHVSLSSRASGGAARDTLCQAAEQGNVPELHSLLAAGAPLNAPDEQGETPLHHAGMLPPLHSTPAARLLELRSGVLSCVWLGAAAVKMGDSRAFYLHAGSTCFAPALLPASRSHTATPGAH